MKSTSIGLAVRFGACATAAAVAAMVYLGPAARAVLADDASPAAAPADQKSTDTNSSSEGQFYKVQVVRPAKVGDHLHMKRDIAQTYSESVEQNGQPRGGQTNSTQLSFSGNLEVLAVDKDNNPVKWKITGGVAKVTGTGGTARGSILKPGTEFTVSLSEDKPTIAESDSQHPLSDDAKKILPYVFSASGGKGDATLDELIDNSTASRTASWNLNEKALLATAHEFDSKLKQADITGTAQIKAVSGVGDKKTLLVEYRYSSNGKNPENPPEGTKPVSDSLVESGTIFVPADGSGGYFSSKVQIHSSGQFQKNETKKQTTYRYGIRQTKDVPVKDQIKIDQIDRINTVITYGSGGEEKKKSQPVFSSDTLGGSSAKTASGN
jgi:hypothetical protein